MKRPTLVYSSLVVLGFLLAGLAFEPVSAKDETYKYLSNLADTIDLIQRNYVDEPELDGILLGAHAGLLEELDAESYYLTPAQLAEYSSAPTARAESGIDVSKRFGYAIVVSVLPGSPADGQLHSGDYLRGIDGESTRGMSLFAIQRRLSGDANSEVRLKVLRRQTYETEQVTLKRVELAHAAVRSEMLEGHLLHIKLAQLDAQSVRDTARALRDSTELEGVVLDLRGCSRGPLTAGAELGDLFVDSGVLLSIHGKTGEPAVKAELKSLAPKRVPSDDGLGYTFTVAAKPNATAWRGPVAVLIDSGTAGPAEVAAAALLTDDRASVIGRRTFGRASLQDTVPLKGGAAVRLTIARVMTPGGESLLRQGLEPSESVEEVPDENGDPALNKALERLRPDDVKKKAA